MATTAMVPILKMDVLMEDFTNIKTLVNQIASDRNKLLELRNSWEVFFLGYDEDPREIPDIPEVVNWYKQSLDEEIPWFYFMKTNYPESMGLAIFMMCCAGEADPESAGRYIFDEEKVHDFIKKNLDNLADFVEKHELSTEIGVKATDAAMECVKKILFGDIDDDQESSGRIDEQKMRAEAIVRLEMLEEQFGLNPNVKKYYGEGKLYYSYLTGGGIMGSIDTINYDKRYARIVNSFEEQTSYLVYHVIEHGEHIYLLFVSDDYTNWAEERPESRSVYVMDVDMKTGENKFGYVLPDALQGALYLKTPQVYAERPGDSKADSELSEIDAEIVERLEILKNTGIETDLDITSVYLELGEICASILRDVFGTPVCVVNTISSTPSYQQLAELIDEKINGKVYFVMSSAANEVVFLYVTANSARWEMDKLALERKIPNAIVLDLEDGSADIRKIRFEIMNGGPLKTEDL